MAISDSLKRRSFGETSRTDAWWSKPLVVFAGLAGFVIYSTWAAFQGEHYVFGNYLSPMYAPEIFGNSPHALFGPKPGWWPAWMPFSPALLILWAPAGFRMTCYYYRGAYYKAFWGDPIACAVGEPRKSYWGENSLPLIVQNLHRYFMYFAIIFLFFLWYDAFASFFFDVNGETRLGIGVGSIVLTANAYLLSGYTLGCHSFRHLVGGHLNLFSNNPLRHKCWQQVTCLNERHQLWAWMSLIVVGFSDLYVRLLSMGIWSDLYFTF